MYMQTNEVIDAGYRQQ